MRLNPTFASNESSLGANESRMGFDWDPEGDAEARRQTRKRWLLAGAITLLVLGYLLKTVIWVDETVNEPRRALEQQRSAGF